LKNQSNRAAQPVNIVSSSVLFRGPEKRPGEERKGLDLGTLDLVNMLLIMVIIEGSLEVKLPTIWTDEKQRWGRGREKRRVEERR